MNNTVLLTGSSGFLGSYIKSELKRQDFKIVGLGRKNSDIEHDLSNGVPKLPADLDFIIHAAGKVHSLPKTKKEKVLFYETNYNGTLNLLEGIKLSGSSIKNIIFISSVAVYGLSKGEDIDESHPLLASEPYGKSKIMAEDAIIRYCNSNHINYCILRLPLVAGKTPPGNLGSMVNAIKKGWYLSIGTADAKKSMVMAKDIASLIPKLFDKSGIYNLTDGYHPTFKELEICISFYLNKRKPLKIPQSLAKMMAKTGDILGHIAPFNSRKLMKIQSTLIFSDKKARTELGWNPLKILDNINDIVE